MRKLPEVNPYRLMWMMVFFDLPVVEEDERRESAQFRKFLLDNGFCMVQFSVYAKICAGVEVCERYYRMIESHLPHEGAVEVLTVTDKQYSGIRSYRGEQKKPLKKQNNQLLLF